MFLVIVSRRARDFSKASAYSIADFTPSATSTDPASRLNEEASDRPILAPAVAPACSACAETSVPRCDPSARMRTTASARAECSVIGSPRSGNRDRFRFGVKPLVELGPLFVGHAFGAQAVGRRDNERE